MMVYGRWRRGPRGGRVGHAVNRRTQPRQNLRRNNRGQESPVACETMRVKLNYLVPRAPPSARAAATAAGSRRKIRRPFMKFYYRVESPVFDAEIRFGVYRVSKGGDIHLHLPMNGWNPVPTEGERHNIAMTRVIFGRCWEITWNSRDGY